MPVPNGDFSKALAEIIAQWNSAPDWEGDERNVVLTLARIWYTASTGRIAPKDVASAWVLERLPVEGAYFWDMVGANERRALDLTFAEITGADQAAAGANLGAEVAKGGINQGYQLDLQANRINYEGAVSAGACQSANYDDLQQPASRRNAEANERSVL
jgi:Domain of unknown function (DUF4111)